MKQVTRLLIIYSCSLIPFVGAAQSESLKGKISQYVKAFDAKVGVAVLNLKTNDTLTVNGCHHYPMQSVYKFHLAVAILDLVDKHKLKLDQPVTIAKSDLAKNTWSPIRDEYPNGGVTLPVSYLIEKSVALSDNTACDILFKMAGGPAAVNRTIHNKGIKDVNIVANEADMQAEYNVQFSNWSTPYAAALLLKRLAKGEILSKASTKYLLDVMKGTSTGAARIKGMLPKSAVVAHKTGSSGTNAEGITAATNDIGIISLPNGVEIALVAFVTESKEKPETNEKIIATIARMVWDDGVQKR